MRLPILILSPLLCIAADWPAWRGPSANGAVEATNLPTVWSKTDNVRWRIALPEAGNSTPVVWGNRIFLTQARKEEGWRGVMCFDRLTGKQLWQSGVTFKQQEPTHSTNPYASASPATDGKIVVAWFGSAGLFAYDLKGRELWRRDLGQQKHTWGYAASPVLHDGRIFLNFGPGARAFLIALEAKSGRTLWQTDAPAGKGDKFSNWAPEDMYGSWSTPLVTGGEVVVSWPQRVVAFDPASGQQRWAVEGMGNLVYPSPVAAEGIIVAMGGFTTPSLAVKAGAALWRLPKSRSLIGSAVILEGRIYTIDNGGIAECLDLATGKSLWMQRLKGSGEDNGVWSSPVLAGGRIYVMNKSGEVFLIKPGPEFELLGKNSVGEPSNSSVVVAAGDLILRTHQALWCIRGETKTAAPR